VAITQVIMRLGERPSGDIEKTREFRRSKSTEAFCDIAAG
jgi:hypothetical protein